MDVKNEECPDQIDYTMQASPKVGMFFQSEDHAYVFYNQYAKSVGFSVRKDSSTVRGDGTVIRRVLCCSKQGYYKNRGLHTNFRATTRTGCEARIIILKRGEKFLVIEFNEFHNHELVSPSEVQSLRSQQKIEDSQARIMRNMYDSGMDPADIYSSMCKTCGPHNLTFSEVDCANYLQRIRCDDNVNKGARKQNSMVVTRHPSLEQGEDHGTSAIVDCQPLSEKGDDLGTSMVIDCQPSSTSQCNDLAHMALTIVAKGNTSENSVVFTRRLLTQVLEELDSFLKSDYENTRQLLNIRNMNYDKGGGGKNCLDEVGSSIRVRDLLPKKANSKVSGKIKGTLQKGEGRKKFQKVTTGSCDRVSIGAIGTTLLMLQDPSMLAKHHHNQACEQSNLPQEDSVR